MTAAAERFVSSVQSRREREEGASRAKGAREAARKARAREREQKRVQAAQAGRRDLREIDRELAGLKRRAEQLEEKRLRIAGKLELLRKQTRFEWPGCR